MKRLLPVAALLISFAILCLGHGLQSVLLPARGAMFPNYPNLITGAMMSAYYAGFIAGTFFCYHLIARVGHIRVFAACTACASAIMLCHALIPNPILWIGIRVIYGFCLVHLYTIMESWLNSIGDAQSRGKILSVYMITNFLAMSAGQSLSLLAPLEGFELFCICAMMLSLAIVPLTLSRIIQPVTVRPVDSFGVRQLMQVSPLGVIGALVAGLMAGGYWGLSAVFIIRIGFEQNAVAWFMAASLMGGLVAQWPLGTLSDRINRRYVIILAASLIALASGFLSLLAMMGGATVLSVSGLIIIAIIFGAGFHPLYSLCIAHANDFIGPEQFVRASAGLQMVQGAGAVAGPLLAGLLMYMVGHTMLFIYISLLAGFFALYTLRRMIENRKPAIGGHVPFRFYTKTGLFAFLMDPRSRAQGGKN